MNTIGFTSTTFRRIKSKAKIVAIAKEAQVNSIEWGGDIHVKNVDDAKEAFKLCSENKITVSSYGSYYKIGSFETKQWLEICKIAKALHAKSIRVWLGKKGSKKNTAQERTKLLEDAKIICDLAKDYGLIVSPECHLGTYNDNTDAFLGFAKNLNCDNFKTYFQSLYKDLPYDIDRLKRTLPYILNVHISYSEQTRMQFFSKRNKNYIDELLRTLKALNFQGGILLEYTYWSLENYFYKDIEKLKKWCGEKS